MNEQYLDLFIDESSQHLQEMTNGLMNLEREPGNLDVIQSVFRAAHTMKGMAATMGFERMAQLTHQMENGLDSMRHGHLKVSESVMDALFTCVDVLGAQLQSIIDTGSDVGVEETAARNALAEVLQSTQVESAATAIVTSDVSVAKSPIPEEAPAWWKPLEGGIQAVSQSGVPVLEITVKMVQDCPMPGVRAFMVYRQVGDFGEVLASDPGAQDIQDGLCGFEVQFVLATSTALDTILASLREMADIDEVSITPITFSHLRETGQSIHEEVDLQASAMGETQASSGKGQHEGTLGDKVGQNPPSRDGEGAATNAQPGKPRRSGQTIRVDQEKIDLLMNLFSEFVIDKTRLESIARQRADGELLETVSHLARIGSDLQDVVLQIRMEPVESVFNRFPRMVRDLAKNLQKRVDLHVEGAETELDRTLVDEIGDPLVHLIRNALDHGLETPQERVAAGKPETGQLRLVAYQAQSKVYIEIADDGHGINRERIVQKAVVQGQITQTTAATLSDEQVYDLLFQSGFSTAEKISDISGRGVGLDVVKSKIQSLGGDVRVQSVLGQGSRFIIELPLTLSIMQAMLIRIAGEIYAVPLGDIAHILRVQEEELQHVRDRDMVVFTDKLIPLFRLPDLLGGSDETASKGAPSAVATLGLGMAVLVVKKGDRHVALQVDDFLGQQEIVIKSIGSYFRALPFGVAGATILGDGRVALILDTNVWTR